MQITTKYDFTDSFKNNKRRKSESFRTEKVKLQLKFRKTE